MADLKLNEELPLNEHTKIKVKNMKGSLRYVGYGITENRSISGGNWIDPGFVSKTIIDSDYLGEGASSGRFKVLKKGKYLFIWKCRAQDSTTSQGVGIWLKSTGAVDNMLNAWGGGRYRDTIQGMYFWNLDVNDEIKVKEISNDSITCKPVEVWIFAVVGL